MMKLVNYLMVMICLETLSCKSKYHPEYSQLIIGEWTFVKQELKYGTKIDPTEPPPIEVGFKSGYEFKESGVCEDKLGYFKHINSNHTHYAQFLGTQTKYRLRDNRLGIFNLAHKAWKEYKILKLDSKTLKFALNDSVYAIYEKNNYRLDPEVPFDQIIVSSSGCYGTCPINDVMISANGEVIFNNTQYIKNIGSFSSHMDSKAFKEAEEKFRKAGLKKLKDKYEAGWTDDNEITVSIIQNGRIYKTISDYGSQAPTELYWAHLPITCLDQKLPLKRLPQDGKFNTLRIHWFEKDDKLIRLAKSEGFYLANLLSSAKSVDKVFKKKYILDAYNEHKSINTTTDGRYYKMRLINGKYLTVDLGYNFLERNDLLSRLSAKLPYEE